MREIRVHVQYLYIRNDIILEIHVYDRDEYISAFNSKRTELAKYLFKDVLDESRRACFGRPMDEHTLECIEHEIKTILVDFYWNEVILLKEGHDILIETMLQKYLMMEELTE